MRVPLALLLLSCGAPAVSPGPPAPELGLSRLEGASVTLASLEGAPTLVVFWASWCGACRREAPEIAALMARYGDQLRVVAVNVGEDAVTARAAADALGLTAVTALDPDGQATARWGVEALPTVLLIDPEARIRFRGHGLPPDLDALLAGGLG